MYAEKESETSDLSGSDTDSDKVNERDNLVYIHDGSKTYLDEVHEVPLSTTPIDIEAEQEETEEVDHLLWTTIRCWSTVNSSKRV